MRRKQLQDDTRDEVKLKNNGPAPDLISGMYINVKVQMLYNMLQWRRVTIIAAEDGSNLKRRDEDGEIKSAIENVSALIKWRYNDETSVCDLLKTSCNKDDTVSWRTHYDLYQPFEHTHFVPGCDEPEDLINNDEPKDPPALTLGMKIAVLHDYYDYALSQDLMEWCNETF